MRGGWFGVVGLFCAWAGAVCWAVGLTVLQPLTEPFGPWPERFASDRTYWARDLRFLAIGAVVAGVVLATRGNRRVAGFGALAALGWVGVDVGLDRADVTGMPATIALSAAACAVVAGTVLAVRRRPTAAAGDHEATTAVRAERPTAEVQPTAEVRPTVDADRPAVPERAVLVLAASVAAALAPVAGFLGSPTDSEPELTPAALAVGMILVVVAAGCALAAAPVVRSRLWATAGYLAVGAAGLVGLRALPPGGRFIPAVLFGAVLLTGATVLAWWRVGGRPDWSRLGLVALGALVGYPALTAATLLLTASAVPVGRPLTRLAGNIAVSAADQDVLYSLAGLVAGAVLGVLLARATPDDDPVRLPAAVS